MDAKEVENFLDKLFVEYWAKVQEFTGKVWETDIKKFFDDNGLSFTTRNGEWYFSQDGGKTWIEGHDIPQKLRGPETAILNICKIAGFPANNFGSLIYIEGGKYGRK